MEGTARHFSLDGQLSLHKNRNTIRIRVLG